jgi:hypothetical protein
MMRREKGAPVVKRRQRRGKNNVWPAPDTRCDAKGTKTVFIKHSKTCTKHFEMTSSHRLDEVGVSSLQQLLTPQSERKSKV